MSDQIVRILHLTDIHFGKDHKFNPDGADHHYHTGINFTSNLISDINNKIQEPPDIVVISGDITSIGSAQEFTEARNFIDNIKQAFGLDVKRFIIIPGNHDVFWGKGDDVSSGDFKSFVANFRDMAPNKTNNPIFRLRNVLIVGIDSTTFMKASLSGIGLVGIPQLEQVNKLISKHDDVLHKILVVHHHLLPVSWVEARPPNQTQSLTFDAPRVLAWAQEHGFTAILHGHQHQSFITTLHYADRDGGPFIVSGGPSAGAKDLPPQGRNGYQWITIDHRRIIFDVREMSERGDYDTIKKIEFMKDVSGVFSMNSIPSSWTSDDLSLEELRKTITNASNNILQKTTDSLGAMGGLRIVDSTTGQVHARDGLRIIKSLKNTNPVQRKIYELADKMTDEINISNGDGRKTTAIIWSNIINNTLPFIDEQHSDVRVADGVIAAAKLIINNIKQKSINCDSTRLVNSVALTACGGETQIADAIISAMETVGNDGVISIEDGLITEEFSITIDLIESRFEFNRIPEWVEEKLFQTGFREIVNPLIVLCEYKIDFMAEINPVLEAAITTNRPIIIISHNFGDEAMEAIALNCRQGVIDCTPIIMRSFNNHNTEYKDMSVLTGVSVFSATAANRVQNAVFDDINAAGTTVRVYKDKIDFIVPGGSTESVRKHAKRLKQEIIESDSDYRTSTLQQRLARIVGGFAILRISDVSETNRKISRQKMSDALSSTRSAIIGGIVRGSGLALHNSASSIDNPSGDISFKLGYNAMIAAAKAPAKILIPDYEVLLSISGNHSATYDTKSRSILPYPENPPADPTKTIVKSIIIAANFAAHTIKTRSVESDIYSKAKKDSERLF